MANWRQVKSYLNNNYRIKQDEGDFVVMVFDTGNGRSQMVFLSVERLRDGTEEWLTILSSVGKVREVNLANALTLIENMVVGGLTQLGDTLMVKHTLPLLNVDDNEIDRPLALVTKTADDLERRLVGGDAY